MQQVPFLFLENNNFTQEDFILSDANLNAYKMIKDWSHWNHDHQFARLLLLHGNTGSGKSHLAHIWQQDNEAIFLNKAQLADNIFGQILLDQECYIIDDIHQIEEQNLLHLLNYMIEQKKFFLLVSNHPPQQLEIKLADLRSRINSIPSVEILPPDLELLRMLLLKNFSDRQLKVSSEVINYLLTRITRSFAAAHHLVNLIDQQALEHKRNITIPFVKNILRMIL